MTKTTSLLQEDAHTSALKEQLNPTLSFDGKRSELTPILIKGFFLTLLTFGVYSFWLKASLRRFYASSTKLNGLPFEYKGTGGQLFKGFLLASLIIISILIFFLGGVLWASPILLSLQVIISYLILLSLVPTAIYLRKHHLLSNTNYLSSYGRMKKKTLVSFIFYYWGERLLSLITAFIYFPWNQKNIAAYITKNASFGGQNFHFNPGKMIHIKSFFIAYLSPLILSILFFVSVTSLPNDFSRYVVLLLSCLIIWVLFILYYASFTKYWISAIGFTQAQANSSLSILRVVTIIFTGIFLITLCLGIFGSISFFILSNVPPRGLNIILLLGLGLIAFSIMSFITALFIIFPVYKELINSTKIEGTLEFDTLEVSSHKRDKGFGSSLFDAVSDIL